MRTLTLSIVLALSVFGCGGKKTAPAAPADKPTSGSAATGDCCCENTPDKAKKSLMMADACAAKQGTCAPAGECKGIEGPIPAGY